MGDTLSHLGDGQVLSLPVDPRTWVDQSGTTRGDSLRAKLLTRDVGSSVMWHRRPPVFLAIKTVTMSIPASTMTPVGEDAELIDTAAGHLDDVNTGRWYSPSSANTTDWWLFTGHLPFAGAAGGVRIAALRLNGAGTIHEGMKITATAAHQVSVQVIDLLEMTSNGNNYAELMAYQTTAAALATVASGKTPSLTARWACSGAGTGIVSALPAAPRTWSSTDVLSGSDVTAGKIPLNTHIRDVIRFLNYPPISRINSQTTVQTIPTGTGVWTTIAMPAETVDNYGGHDNVTNNSRYTCQRAGLYYIAGLASVVETAANVGFRAARLLHTIALGGTAIYPGASTIPVSNSTTGTAIYATGWVRMAVGDYVELQFQHTQGASLTVASSAGTCSRLIAVWRSL